MTQAELDSKLTYWRQKQAQDGLSIDELVEVVELLSQGRQSAQIASTTSRGTKAAAATGKVVAADTLSDIFGALGA